MPIFLLFRFHQLANRFAERADLRFFVCGAHGNAQPRGAFGHGWIADCWDEKSFVLQRSRKVERRFLVADDPRENCAASAALFLV